MTPAAKKSTQKTPKNTKSTSRRTPPSKPSKGKGIGKGSKRKRTSTPRPSPSTPQTSRTVRRSSNSSPQTSRSVRRSSNSTPQTSRSRGMRRSSASSTSTPEPAVGSTPVSSVAPGVRTNLFERFEKAMESFEKFAPLMESASSKEVDAQTKKEIATEVHDLVKGMKEDPEETLWDLDIQFSSRHNRQVNLAIQRGVLSKLGPQPTKIINGCIRSLFRARQRLHRLRKKGKYDEFKKKQRRFQRMDYSRHRRLRALAKAKEYDVDMREKLNLVLQDKSYISSEETMSEDADEEGDDLSPRQLQVKTLVWRSDHLNDNFRRLDRLSKITKCGRSCAVIARKRLGKVSMRQQPEAPYDWAIRSSGDSESPEESDE